MIGFAFTFTRLVRIARIALAVAILLLWVCSMPIFASFLTGLLERQSPVRSIASATKVDAIVILGGGLARGGVALGHNGDRLLQAYLLWRAGKASSIIVTGGKLPWEGTTSEAELAGEVLMALGVDQRAIILETASANTRQNAVNAARLWRQQGFRTGLLVTSAAHMPRALATFRRVGLPVDPWPADGRSGTPGLDSVLDLLPDANALARTTASIKEFLGMAVYWLRGWT